MSAVLIGILLDVSGSMKTSIGDEVGEEGGPWTRSIFRVIDDLVKHDVSNNNDVFAIAFGGSQRDTFDILGTIEDAKKLQEEMINAELEAWFERDGERIMSNEEPAELDTVKEIFRILEYSGARELRRWTNYYMVQRAVTKAMSESILKALSADRGFAKTFVDEYLPPACRRFAQTFVDDYLPPAYRIGSIVSGIVSRFKQATQADILKVVACAMESDDVKQNMSAAANDQLEKYQKARESAKKEIEEKVKDKIFDHIKVRGVGNRSVFNAHDAADIIHGCVEEKELTNERARELLKIIEPFIYEGTPLYAALTESLRVFSESARTRRLLFVLSDGDPGDKGDIASILSLLKDQDVAVVTCFIQRSTQVQPRRLYNVADESWEKGARFLFNLSSTAPTELIIRDIFIRNGWQIDIDNNETKLFAHVNHPDHIKDVCRLSRNAICCQDALADLLISVDLDIYINQQKSSIGAHKQEHETCYANAIATVVHLAMHRTRCRQRISFEELRDDMISKYGIEGGNTFPILKRVCRMYKLKCEKLGLNDDADIDQIEASHRAMQAVAAKRPVVARFELTDDEWDKFECFYEFNPKGVLNKDILDISKRSPYAKTRGHAVVLTSFNSECFYLMNSWGDDWADNGFFRVANADVLKLTFFDVHWNLDEYNEEERVVCRTHASEVASKLMKSLKALQEADFPCPLCGRSSNVTEYKGTLSRVRCPKCCRKFPCKDVEGNILALNVHLTSLAY